LHTSTGNTVQPVKVQSRRWQLCHRGGTPRKQWRLCRAYHCKWRNVYFELSQTQSATNHVTARL